MKGGAKVAIEAHRHEGVFIARSKEVRGGRAIRCWREERSGWNMLRIC